MASETFELILARVAFGTTNQRNAAQRRVENFIAGRSEFRDPIINPLPAGKVGPGPGLAVTVRLDLRADADALWADLEQQAFPTITDGFIWQNSVTQDTVEGTSSVVPVHQRSFPADPSDF